MAEETLATYLNRLLEKAGLDGSRLRVLLAARRTPITKGPLNAILQGKSIPKPRTIRALADVPALRRAGADYETMMRLAGHLSGRPLPEDERQIREAAARYEGLSPTAREIAEIYEILDPADRKFLESTIEYIIRRRQSDASPPADGLAEEGPPPPRG